MAAAEHAASRILSQDLGSERIDEARVEQFAEKVASDQAIGAAGVLAYLGDRLGLWKAMGAAGAVTADALAAVTGLHPRYLTEWLAAEAAAGYVAHDPQSGRFTLPAEHAAVLADDDSPAALAGGFEFQAGCWAAADRLAEAFASGQGLSWAEQDPRVANGAARFFRPLYAASLVDEWLPALGDVIAVLERGARVLDVACGHGAATILMAEAFPQSTFKGVDVDESSLAQARVRAERAGLAPRVSFEVARADDDLGDGWDLICFFDAFHHIGDPVAAARRAREALAPGGALMLVEPLARDRVEDNLATHVALDFYSASTMVCVPDALAQPGGVALGAQAGPKRLREVLDEADFGQVRVAHTSDFHIVLEARR